MTPSVKSSREGLARNRTTDNQNMDEVQHRKNTFQQHILSPHPMPGHSPVVGTGLHFITGFCYGTKSSSVETAMQLTK